MSKIKQTAYFCSQCGYESPKWLGQCPACREWNTMVEEPVAPKKTSVAAVRNVKARPEYLKNVSLDDSNRYATGFNELDRVLGGGIVAGSLILVGGDPGIGKSTILLQVCRNLAADGKNVLYIS